MISAISGCASVVFGGLSVGCGVFGHVVVVVVVVVVVNAVKRDEPTAGRLRLKKDSVSACREEPRALMHPAGSDVAAGFA